MFWKHLDVFQEKLEERLEEFHTWGYLKIKAEMFVDYICSPKTCKQQASKGKFITGFYWLLFLLATKEGFSFFIIVLRFSKYFCCPQQKNWLKIRIV